MFLLLSCLLLLLFRLHLFLYTLYGLLILPFHQSVLHSVAIYLILNLLYRPLVLQYLECFIFYPCLQLSNSLLECFNVFVVVDLLGDPSGVNDYFYVVDVIQYLD